MKNKKKIIIVIVVVIILGSFLMYFLFSKEKGNYPEEPIIQKSLSVSSQGINLDKTEIPVDEEYLLWTISNSVKLDSVEKMLQEIDSNFKIVDSEEGAFYRWNNGKDEVLYDLNKNYLIFEFSKGIEFNEAEITNNSFENFVKKYLEEDWQYNVFKSEKGMSEETIYFARRVLSENSQIELREHYQQTDYLALKNGKIVYGKLLLTRFVKTDIDLPLIDSEELGRYLNMPEYPKEIYPQYGAIDDSVLIEVDYLSEEFEELIETLDNCNSTSSEVIYLYKSFGQELLTPVYKLNLQCEITYKDQQYSIPAIAYVNAINPDYVYIPE